jgi:hypothetical protein
LHLAAPAVISRRGPLARAVVLHVASQRHNGSCWRRRGTSLPRTARLLAGSLWFGVVAMV